MMAMVPVHAVGMFAAYTKFTAMFNPSKVAAQMRQKQRMKQFNSR